MSDRPSWHQYFLTITRNVAERSGRLQDGKHGLEELRREGYM